MNCDVTNDDDIASVVHEFKRVLGTIQFIKSTLREPKISDVLHILGHKVRVHPDYVNLQRVVHKILFGIHALLDDLVGLFLINLAIRIVALEHQSTERSMQGLVGADLLVGERQPWHDPSFL